MCFFDIYVYRYLLYRKLRGDICNILQYSLLTTDFYFKSYFLLYIYFSTRGPRPETPTYINIQTYTLTHIIFQDLAIGPGWIFQIWQKHNLRVPLRAIWILVRVLLPAQFSYTRKISLNRDVFGIEKTKSTASMQLFLGSWNLVHSRR